MNITKIKFLIFCAFSLATNILFAYEGDVFVSLTSGSRYYCLVNDVYGNGLAIYRDGNLSEIGLNRRIKNLRTKIILIRSQIAEAREESDFLLESRLRSNLRKKRTLRGLLLECQDQVGRFDPFSSPVSDSPSDPETPPTDPDNGESPCSVIGNNNSLTTQSLTYTPRIINGTQCTVGNSPTVELELFAGGQGQGVCTGTVVNSRTVITAAHCAEGITSMRIYHGSGVITSNQIYVHPSYDANSVNIQNHDVAVVVTGIDIPTRRVNILGINNLTFNELGVIGGYGLSDGTNDNSSGFLRAASVLIDTFAGGSIGTVFTGEDPHGNTCFGDSGGPLMVKRSGEWLLAGVTSNGVSDFCEPTDFSYYANLTSSSNRNFINSIVPGLIN